MVNELRRVTGFDVGLTGDEQIRTALQRIIERGGEAQITDIYDAVEDRLLPTGCGLSRTFGATRLSLIPQCMISGCYENRPGCSTCKRNSGQSQSGEMK